MASFDVSSKSMKIFLDSIRVVTAGSYGIKFCPIISNIESSHSFVTNASLIILSWGKP